MTCWSVQRRTHDYVDGRLRGSELNRVERHLSGCEDCRIRTNEVHSVRSSLRRLPTAEIPQDLRLRLRVMASQERVELLETNGSRLLRFWRVWKFRLNEMMRPLTIPATGGFLSALALFGVFAFTVGTTTRAVGYDVPVIIWADHIDANLVPMELRSLVVVTFSTDGNGRITDFAFRDDSRSVVGNTGSLQSNNISLPDIPGLITAHSMSSDVSISFKPIVFRP